MSDAATMMRPLDGVALDGAALDRLFREARTRNSWVKETLPEQTWRDLYDLMRMGPTAANASPARLVFVTSEEGKQRLAPHLSETNRAKTLGAPAIAIVAYDLDFPEQMGKLFPHNPGAKRWFDDPAARQATAFRNGSMQGGYLVIAARAMGLDAGPMSGFDNAGVDAEFFAGINVRSNFICALGHGADEPFPRNPRLAFEEACRIV